MKVKILKDHTIYKKGIVEVDGGRGRYLIAIGVAEVVTEKKEIKQEVEKKEITKGKEKKEK